MHKQRTTKWSAALAATAAVLVTGVAAAGPASADEPPLGQGEVAFWEEAAFGSEYVRYVDPGSECVNLPFSTRMIANMVGPIDVHAGPDCTGGTYHSPDRDLHQFPGTFRGLSFRVVSG
ncbi:hypothetical protein [Streptomyces marincola]|uniref:hypothetical protein n=1 Tax=Streptomyces marincola TaxID=2878388 RepID=UPI001CF16E0A|nr:hypothetical protein [Streptomyces marincola]UCM87906.1 hypothetical protein LC193_08020 [Streptomyces marincola]